MLTGWEKTLEDTLVITGMPILKLLPSLALQTAPPAATRKQLVLVGIAQLPGTQAQADLVEEVILIILLNVPVLPTVPPVYIFAPRQVVPPLRKPKGIT